MFSSREHWRQFWIFQANPKQYDALLQLKVDQKIDWYVTRFIERYREGDIVYLWIAGENAGIYGWAEVQGEVFQDENGKQRLTAVYRGVFAKPLEKSFLRSQPKVFDGLSILRNPTGSNFRTTVLEVIELNRLIAANGDTAPDDPDQIEDPNALGEMYCKAVYVLDYRFDKDVKSIIASCLVTSRNINQTFFPQLIIQIPFYYYASLLQQKAPSEFALALNKIIPVEKIQNKFRFASQIVIEPGTNLSAELASGIMVKRNVLLLLTEARRIAIKTTGKELITPRHLVGAILQGVVEPIQNYVSEDVLGPLSLQLSEVRNNYVELIASLWPEDKQNVWKALVNEELFSDTTEEVFSPLLTKIDSDTADEANEDFLNIDDDAIAIAKVLCAKDASPPLAFGLFGEWGSGKTFFMHRIHRHVESLTSRVADSGVETNRAYQSKVAQIWFNAWNYQDGKLWASLVNHVFVGLKQELKRFNKDTADEEFKKLMERLDEGRVIEKSLKSSSVKINALENQEIEITQRIDALNSVNESIQEQEPDESLKIQTIEKLKGHDIDIEAIFKIEGAEEKLTSNLGNIEQVKDIVEKLSKFAVIERLKQWLRFFTRNRNATLLLVVSVFLIVIVCAILIKYNNVLGSIGATMTLMLSIMSARLSKFGKFLKLIDSIKQDIDKVSEENHKAVQQKLEQNLKEMQKLKIQQLEIQAEIDSSQKEFDQLNARYGKASDETFTSFIFDRAASSDYKSHLGLLNLVRRDFSRLNKLLTSQEDSSLPKIDRIVLYIDDLDRCEPEIVVDVLQAIHLMLAFPLFMVVVGVDARWLGRSLKRRYTFLVHEKDDKNNHDLDHYAASTHDYLEKIFQIPFWLKRMDGKRANDMMKALLTTRQNKNDKRQGIAVDIMAQPSQHDSLIETGNEEPVAELFEDSEDQEIGYVEVEDSDELLINNLISTRSLEMSDPELQFFQQLGAIVGRSPRAVKRFINLYRILKASHKKARVVGFSEQNGGFQVPLFLLAVICGSPKEAEQLFRFFKQQVDNNCLHHTLVDASNYLETAGWLRLINALNESIDIIGTFELKSIKDWIPDVARFSYREWVE